MSAKRFSLDSNLLVYTFDYGEPKKRDVAEQIVQAAATLDCMLALQAVGEFFSVTTRKRMLSRTDAAREVVSFLDLFPSFPASLDAHRRAATEAAAGRFSYWDAVLLASADEAGCTMLLSEDMKDGAKLGGITVRNPFGTKGLSAAAAAALNP